MNVHFTPRARLDLVEIGDWIARSSRSRAYTFVSELQAKARELAATPEAFAVLPGLSRIRRRPYGDYLIIYRIEDSAVVILRILHGARDIDGLLSD